MGYSSAHETSHLPTYAFKEGARALEAGLRSSDAFVLRRCQILLASARGERAPRIAENLGCGSQTARNAIHDFNEKGIGALEPAPRVQEVHAAFHDAGEAQSLRQMLHHRPSEFGKEGTFWTLAMAAEVSFEEGITQRGSVARPSGPPGKARGALAEGKRWMESPDPEYARKRGSRSADPAGREPSGVGSRLRG